jgi:signal transduction histidine kinase
LPLLDYRQGSMRRFGIRALSGSAPDVALAALLTALNVLSSGWQATPVAVAIVEAAPVALRRRTPLAALVATAIAALVGVVLGLRPSAPGFVAILVLLAAVTSVHRLRVSIPAGVLVGAGAIIVLREQDVVAVGFELALVIAAWILGFNARTRRSLTAALADLASSAEHARQEEASRAATEERARLAREVHDIVAHSLSVIVVQAGAGRTVAAEAPDEAREALTSIERTGREALGEIRRLVGVLRSGADRDGREPVSGLGRLELLLERFRASGLEVHAQADGALNDLPTTIDLSAYRIVQEALTNCLRHAKGARAQVKVVREERALLVEVTNDAQPGATPSLGGGHGLPGMRERVAVHRGDFEAGPLPGGGWRVLARLPLEPTT